ncbi:hypothetical protein [Ktedonospora formicarum]|uniref:DUF5667 domain-containing protein n=1 Tax=Ktedonospora formicarum TaxID=2778364 RepID=A0A8J3MWC9_9CHLR|nr:hypothetical protein [Ktedonospora formicarum]GHO48851.1 hypothetical protein KSX_70140 [Ktedonospora formicarum]
MKTPFHDFETQPERLLQQQDSQTAQGSPQASEREDTIQPLRMATSSTHEDANTVLLELLAVAQTLQAVPQLQVDAEFAHRLEHRLLARQVTLKRASRRSSWWQLLLRPSLSLRPLVGVAVLCLLIVFFATGILVAAAHTTNPSNPLYSLKRWEYQMQAPLSGKPTSLTQAEWDAQFAQDQLSVLTTLASTGQAPQSAQYRDELATFDQAMRIFAHDIEQLPQGTDRQRMEGEYTSRAIDARGALHTLLGHLPLAERQQTTVVLGHLGELVPHLTTAIVTTPAHGTQLLTITLTGDHFQSGAQLLINNRVMTIQGTLQQDQYVFVLTWNSAQIHSVGLLNRDGTVVQTTSIERHQNGTGASNQGNSNTSKGHGNENSGNTSGSENGDNRGNGSNGNGNKSKPPVTPTPPPHQ